MLCLMYNILAPTTPVYLVTVGRIMDCSCRFLCSFSTSEKLVILFSKSKVHIKTLFQIMD